MPSSDAEKRVKMGTRGTSGPNGTASNRAEKSGQRGTSGRSTTSDKTLKSTPQKKLPNSQGT